MNVVRSDKKTDNVVIDKLPKNVKKYAETPEFTHETVPAKLTQDHSTKPGVWARICVLQGKLDYIIPSAPERSHPISAGEFGIIHPEELHSVEPLDFVSFKVEFYRVDT